MKPSKPAALVVVLALVCALASPPRAQASDSALEITLYVLAGIAVFAGVVIVGTLLTRDETRMFVLDPMPPEEEEKKKQSGLSFGTACQMPDGRPAIACW